VKLQELPTEIGRRQGGRLSQSGGPAFRPSVLAMTPRPPENADAAVGLMPGAFATPSIASSQPRLKTRFTCVSSSGSQVLSRRNCASGWELRPADAEVVLHPR